VKSPDPLPFVIVAPQGIAGEWWNPWKVNDLVDSACEKYRIDPERIYLTGLSMGGFGTYETAIRWPDRFAAIAPVAGGGNADDAPALVNLPIWATHGAKDPKVPIELDLRIVNAIRQLGGRVKFTVDPEAGHDSWTKAYSDPDLYTWLLAQTRGHPAQPRASTLPVSFDR
jgi:predicted peptidase